jgi:hypothetical protein
VTVAERGDEPPEVDHALTRRLVSGTIERERRPKEVFVDGVLTIDEIEARFPSEWVLIGDPQVDEDQQLLAGEVLFHSPERDEVDRKLLELRPPRFAFRYLGTLPEDVALVL